jgi:hypothetical protein
MAARHFEGYDPHDVLSSPVVTRLTFGRRWLAVGWTQLGKRSPFQLRPLLKVRPAQSATTMGLVLASYARLARLIGWERFASSAGSLVRWLQANGERRWGGVGWGYPFPWANRDFMVPAGTPSGVVTAFVGHALLDIAEEQGVATAARLAEAASEFVERALWRVAADSSGGFCFSYTPLDTRAVHNANLLAASLLARVAARRNGHAGGETALQAARWTVRAQAGDGSWPYGIGQRNAWIDSFHTSYNLVALREIGRRLQTEEFEPALRRGAEFWRRAFVRGPAVGFFAFRPYPVDTHAVAHAIITFVALRDLWDDAIEQAERLAGWALANMRHRRAPTFWYQRHRWTANRLVYVRWTQAWMLAALADLAAVTANAPSPAVVPTQ